MTAGLTGRPIAVDTMIISWLLSRNPKVAHYEPHLTGRQLVISFTMLPNSVTVPSRETGVRPAGRALKNASQPCGS